ncbi:MAG TPA: glucosamine-6-phosphate deaminase [Geothrix sp.]|nr:glucosamine-6-phosphate deaminase [Geothrix sp.]
MEVIILPNQQKAAYLVAQILAKELKARPRLVLGMATGRTMEPVYRLLVDLHREAGLDFSQCSTFNLDEYIGIPADHPCSYRRYMNELLFDHVNIPKVNTHLPDGMAPDLGAECQRYEAAITQAGGIDLQLVGIGSDGHIGFNEPLSSLRSRTREKALTPATREQNAPMFGGDPAGVPRRAITMGVGTILDSRRCLMLVTGKSKAAILAKAVEGPISSMVTASALQLHPRCQVVVDEEAASELNEIEYHRWVFANEPEWAEFQNLL